MNDNMYRNFKKTIANVNKITPDEWQRKPYSI
jgi:hypothetical protein